MTPKIPDAATPVLNRIKETGEWRVVGYQLASQDPQHVLTTTHRQSTKAKRLHSVKCLCGWSGVTAKTLGTVLVEGKLHHLDKFGPPCPNPTKARFSSEEAASCALLAIWQRTPEEVRTPLRAYECACGKWHLTSQSLTAAR